MYYIRDFLVFIYEIVFLLNVFIKIKVIILLNIL